MNNLTELKVRKTKSGWIASDERGHSATGLTRQLAINNYHLAYNRPEIKEYKYEGKELHEINLDR